MVEEGNKQQQTEATNDEGTLLSLSQAGHYFFFLFFSLGISSLALPSFSSTKEKRRRLELVTSR
jgi:hypothetical protein